MPTSLAVRVTASLYRKEVRKPR